MKTNSASVASALDLRRRLLDALPSREQALVNLIFLKGEPGLVSGQFNGDGASERLALWAELAGSAIWQLYALRAVATFGELKLPQVSSSQKVTPGAVRRMALALFARLGMTAPTPRKRGKSPGRATGTRLKPRKRYRIFRKRKRKKAA